KIPASLACPFRRCRAPRGQSVPFLGRRNLNRSWENRRRYNPHHPRKSTPHRTISKLARSGFGQILMTPIQNKGSWPHRRPSGKTSMLLPIIESCEGCGACCLNVTFPPFGIDEAENRGVPDEFMKSVDDRLRHSHCQKPEPCVWLDEVSLRCKHYNWRPAICRRFELGGLQCREDRALIGIDRIDATV